jgi:hypothetical protein
MRFQFMLIGKLFEFFDAVRGQICFCVIMLTLVLPLLQKLLRAASLSLKLWSPLRFFLSLSTA